MVACAPSPSRLKGAVADKPGVLRVRVADSNDGDNDSPFAHIPLGVKVKMHSTVTSDEVMAVFDAYDDQIDAGDVISVDVTLAGTKAAALSASEDIHVTREAVVDLVGAQHDDDVLNYRREAYPVMESVDIELARGGFADVVAAADSYRDVEALDSVTVVSGNFVLIRDKVNDDPRVTSARERLVRRIAARFRLTGATVSGRGPLTLNVTPADAQTVLRFAARKPEAKIVEKVVVPGASTRTAPAGPRGRTARQAK